MSSEVWCEILNVLKCYVEKKCCKVYFSDKALNLWQKTKNLLEIVENLKIIVCYVINDSTGPQEHNVHVYPLYYSK